MKNHALFREAEISPRRRKSSPGHFLPRFRIPPRWDLNRFAEKTCRLEIEKSIPSRRRRLFPILKREIMALSLARPLSSSEQTGWTIQMQWLTAVSLGLGGLPPVMRECFVLWECPRKRQFLGLYALSIQQRRWAAQLPRPGNRIALISHHINITLS